MVSVKVEGCSDNMKEVGGSYTGFYNKNIHIIFRKEEFEFVLGFLQYILQYNI